MQPVSKMIMITAVEISCIKLEYVSAFTRILEGARTSKFARAVTKNSWERRSRRTDKREEVRLLELPRIRFTAQFPNGEALYQLLFLLTSRVLLMYSFLLLVR